MKPFQNLITEFESFIIGKSEKVELMLTCLLGKGHLLIEDIPGVGKTTMAKTLASLSGLSLSRIQFTSDLLPNDILGGQVFDEEKKQLIFRPGPIFGELILADELNRASPRTQSALLEVMEENKVTIEGSSYQLPYPFFVIATQNPKVQIGTHPLPQSQLDRFALKMSMGFPDRDSELKILQGLDQSQAKGSMLLSKDRIEKAQAEVDEIHASEAVLNYILRILEQSRQSHQVEPLSVRAGQDLLRLSKAYCYIQGDKALLPDHIKFLAPYIIGHRLASTQQKDHTHEHSLGQELINQTEIY